MTCDRPTYGTASVDQRIGRRLRRLRANCGLSQQRLGAIIGVSYQQVQKYEAGHNRISASALFGVARHCGVPLAWFFQDDGIANAGGHTHKPE